MLSDGSKLSAIGPAWERLLRKLSDGALAVERARMALMDYSGTRRLQAAIVLLEALGV